MIGWKGGVMIWVGIPASEGAKANPTPAWRKRKRIRVIEDSYGDPGTFRALQSRGLF